MVMGNKLTTDRKKLNIRKIRITIITDDTTYVDVWFDGVMYCKLSPKPAISDASNYDAMLRFYFPVLQSAIKQIHIYIFPFNRTKKHCHHRTVMTKKKYSKSSRISETELTSLFTVNVK